MVRSSLPPTTLANPRYLFNSNVGLLITTGNLSAGTDLSNSGIAPRTAFDPGVVLLRNIDGTPVQSSGNASDHFEIDGKDIALANAIESGSNPNHVTTGFELILRDQLGNVSAVEYNLEGYRVAVDAASITETLNIHINPVNDAPRLTGNQPAMADGTENSPYTFSIDNLTAGFADVDGDAISLDSSTLNADNGNVVDNGDGTFTLTPNENFAGAVNLSYTLNDGNGGTIDAIQSFELLPINDPLCGSTPQALTSVTFNIDEDADVNPLA